MLSHEFFVHASRFSSKEDCIPPRSEILVLLYKGDKQIFSNFNSLFSLNGANDRGVFPDSVFPDRYLGVFSLSLSHSLSLPHPLLIFSSRHFLSFPHLSQDLQTSFPTLILMRITSTFLSLPKVLSCFFPLNLTKFSSSVLYSEQIPLSLHFLRLILTAASLPDLTPFVSIVNKGVFLHFIGCSSTSGFSSQVSKFIRVRRFPLPTPSIPLSSLFFLSLSTSFPFSSIDVLLSPSQFSTFPSFSHLLHIPYLSVPNHPRCSLMTLRLATVDSV